MAGSLDNFFVAPAAPAAAPSASPASPVTTSGGFANFFGAPAPAPAAQPVAQPTAQPGIVPGASAQNPVATSGANENLSPEPTTPETQQAVDAALSGAPNVNGVNFNPDHLSAQSDSIDASNARLTAMKKQIDSLPPATDQATLNSQNALIDSYNKEANSTKSDIDTYNSQVRAYQGQQNALFDQAVVAPGILGMAKGSEIGNTSFPSQTQGTLKQLSLDDSFSTPIDPKTLDPSLIEEGSNDTPQQKVSDLEDVLGVAGAVGLAFTGIGAIADIAAGMSILGGSAAVTTAGGLDAATAAMMGTSYVSSGVSSLVSAGASVATFTALNDATKPVLNKILSSPNLSDKGKAYVELADIAVNVLASYGLDSYGGKFLDWTAHNTVESYSLPKTMNVDGSVIQKGLADGSITQAQLDDMAQQYGWTDEEKANVAKSGISVKVPTFKVMTTADRPWWKATQSAFGFDEAPDRVSATRQGPFDFKPGNNEGINAEGQNPIQMTASGSSMTPDDVSDIADRFRQQSESSQKQENDQGDEVAPKTDNVTESDKAIPDQVFLTRHGVNANDETKVAGDNDQPDISEKGQEQMNAAIPDLKGKGITDVISSDAKRAVTSAKIVADGIGAKTTVDKGLRTQDIGNLAGKPSSEADAIMKYTNENHPDQKVGVDGESHNEFKARVEKAYTAQMERVKAEGGTPDIIAHGDVARLIQTDFGKKELSGPEMKHGSTVQVGGEEKNPTEKPNKDNSEKKPTEYNQNSEVLKAFGSSKPIKEIDGFVLGTFGERTGERKVGQADRFPESELPETISHITESYRASDNPKNYRYDNTANIAKMPDGETRVIYTRLNAEGKPEILNWHVITDPEYLETLKENGVSERNRTPNRLVRTEPLNPLSYGDKESVPQKSEESQKKDSLSRVVGGGETKKSGLATDIETRAIEDKIVKNGFENLTASERMVMADQEKMADDLYHNDPEQAIRIATGEEEPPEGVSASVVYAKVRDVSFKSGDSDTLSRLAGATEMNNAATAAGQFIKGLDAFRSEAAMAVTNGIKEINRALEESVQKSLPKGETVEKVRTRMVKRMKSDLASRIKEPTFGQVKDFIKSIEC